MGLLRWLAFRFPNLPLHRVSALAVDERGIRCVRRSGVRETIDWKEIRRVLIRTSDRGPFDEDVFFVLETAAVTLVVPQDVKASYELLDHLQRLPGFDNRAVIEAMSCTDNREFLCWQQAANAESDKPDDRPSG